VVGIGRIGRWKTAQGVRRSGHDRPGDGLGANWQRQGAIWRRRGAGARCAHGAWRSKGWMGRRWPRLMDDDSVLGFVPRLLTRSLTEGLDKITRHRKPDHPRNSVRWRRPDNSSFAYLSSPTTGNPRKCIIPASNPHTSQTSHAIVFTVSKMIWLQKDDR